MLFLLLFYIYIYNYLLYLLLVGSSALQAEPSGCANSQNDIKVALIKIGPE